MEIILGGWSNKTRTGNGPGGCVWPNPTGERWVTMVIAFDTESNPPLQLRSKVMSGYGGGAPGETSDHSLIPAVGDMNGDGKKEVVSTSRDYIWIRTYDPATQTLSLVTQVTRPGHPNAATYFGGIGPTLVDLDNDGTLRALLPYQDDQNRTFVNAIDINGNNRQNWGPGGNLLPGTYALNLREQIAAGDVRRNGLPFAALHTTGGNSDPVFWVQNDQSEFDPNARWPVPTNNNEHPAGVMLSMADIGYGAFVNLFGSGKWRNNNLHVMSIEEGIETEFNFTGDSYYSTPIITNLNDDNRLEVISSSFNANRTRMYVRVWELTGQNAPDLDESGNELAVVEWSQLGNGPRHTGLYAQPYKGWLPRGSTYWRDRVIVADDVSFGYNQILQFNSSLYIMPNTVVEFNTETGLRSYGQSLNYEFWAGRNIVFKPNEEGGWYYLPLVYGGELEDGLIVDGRFQIQPGGSMTFIGCQFISAIGSGTAFTADSATVSFHNCTFRGYSTALSLSKCTGTIENCTFEDITGIAVSLENCTSTGGIEIENCTFTNSGNAAVYAYNSVVDIRECTITGSGQGTLGAAVYGYNSTLTLFHNDISGNALSAVRNTGGGALFLTDWLTTFANRFSDNLTASHTPKTDSTWAELIQVSPSYTYWSSGHNDFINNAGDYLISSHGYNLTQMPFDGSYNYYKCNGTVGSGDFYPTSSVTYSPSDLTPNYTSSIEDERAALSRFRSAKFAADSGNYAAAREGYLAVVSDYPATAVAPGALKMWYLLSTVGEREAVLNEIAEDRVATSLGKYAFRLANQDLVEAGEAAGAVARLEAALEDAPARLDSLYYAIDLAYAELALIRQGGDELDAAGNDRRVLALHKKIDALLANLNGRPFDSGAVDAGLPNEFALLEAFPNPFNSSLSIHYTLPRPGHWALRLYDPRGAEVMLLKEGFL
ncbi:MAG: hypothetical protein FJY67_10390, partial [Calditrichaeota bacterium]|nr:hypothetical protein [Calditrichota bacterium]